MKQLKGYVKINYQKFCRGLETYWGAKCERENDFPLIAPLVLFSFCTMFLHYLLSNNNNKLTALLKNLNVGKESLWGIQGREYLYWNIVPPCPGLEIICGELHVRLY